MIDIEEAEMASAEADAVEVIKLEAEIDRLRAERAAKDARVEEQNAIIHGMQDGALVRDQMGIIERANARIAELEENLTIMQSSYCTERAEAELAKCEAGNTSYHESYVKRHNDAIEAKERAEQAEAQLNHACGREHDAKERCAELEKQCAELSGELEAAGIECKEAEAQLAEAKAALEAVVKDLTYFARKEGGPDNRFSSLCKARAALAPSPAREKS